MVIHKRALENTIYYYYYKVRLWVRFRVRVKVTVSKIIYGAISNQIKSNQNHSVYQIK